MFRHHHQTMMNKKKTHAEFYFIELRKNDVKDVTAFFLASGRLIGRCWAAGFLYLSAGNMLPIIDLAVLDLINICARYMQCFSTYGFLYPNRQSKKGHS